MTEVGVQGVDLHHHLIPPAYRKELTAAGVIDPIPGVDYPDWSIDQSLEVMDRNGIGVAMLSVTEPGVHFTDGDDARRIARGINEFAAEQIRERPDRFGAFATLPLPDVDGALEELSYAIDELGLDGVAMMTNYHGLYPGQPQLRVILEEADRRGLPVFFHPATPPNFGDVALGLPVSLYEFTFETTRMVVNLLYEGVLDKHPDLKIILSHAGGTLPYLANRLTYGPTISKALTERAPEDLVASLRRLYYDTAMSANEFTLPSLQTLIDPEHIVLGTDYPFMPEQTTIETLAGVANFAGFDDGARKKMLRDNALRLFPRVKAQLDQTNEEQVTNG
jgi:predicted TIM-barrel fold metal-dependent hydrolase